MIKFITYKTPEKFSNEFRYYYSFANLKQVRAVSFIFLFFTSTVLAISYFFNEVATSLSYFNELSTVITMHAIGSLTFTLISSYALKTPSVNKAEREGIVFLFALYLLTMSLCTSHILSLHNAKNMLTMYLINIGIVSLFFVFEARRLLLVVFYISSVFFMLMIYPSMSLHDRSLNTLAGFVLSIVLIVCSRYCYYFKSTHFVKLKEMEEKNLEILKLNSQKGEILSFVAHDLRAPLNNIEALSELLLLENHESKEAKMIVNSTHHARTIINDLIEAAKQDDYNFSTQAINLNDFISNIIYKWRNNTERLIDLVSDEDNIIIQANASKLERVIDNLISNAFKFSNIYKPINISIIKKDAVVLIKVIDFGIGIPQHLQTFIFDQFSKAGREGLHGEKSIGLGLHISHRIIERHQGELTVESKENEGTTFIIQLPLKSA